MPTAIRAANILIREGPWLNSFPLDTEAYSGRWRLLQKLDGYGLDRMIRAAGWTFFVLAGEIKAFAFGSGAETNTKAVQRLLSRVGASKFNCLEITSVLERRFLGIPYVSVTGHSRHIQQGYVLRRNTRIADRSPAAA